MNSENQISHNVSGCLDVRDLPPNAFKSTPFFEIGKWYWIQYGVCLTNSWSGASNNYTQKEVQKCIDIWDAKDGKHGVFKTSKLGLRSISENNCFSYNGPMKKEFIIWGADIPDV